MSISKQRRKKILDVLFTRGYSWEECKRIYERLRLLKSKTGKATLRFKLIGKEEKEYLV